MPVLSPNVLAAERVGALHEAHIAARCPRATVNLSGGIDSAVIACLAVLAIGADNVTLDHTCLSTSGEQTNRAINLAKALNCKLAVGQFTGTFNVLMEEFGRSLEAAGFDRDEVDARCAKDPTILGSIRSIFRTTLGRGYNRLTGGGLYHGTGNECEDRYLRFYQKGGDGEVDSNPIAMLSKGEVYQLALALANQMGPTVKAALLPIIGATPSPDLWGVGDAHSDESELANWLNAPFTYSRISVETGEYVKVGTIERVARFLDLPHEIAGFPEEWTVEKVLFGRHKSSEVTESIVDTLVAHACSHPLFNGTPFSPQTPNVRVGAIPMDIIKALLMGARKAEAATRHKMNPNIPTYGDRASLVEAGILTNDLPSI